MLRAPRCPLLLAAVAYSGGILFAQHAWRPALWWLAAAITLALGAIVFAFQRSRVPPTSPGACDSTQVAWPIRLLVNTKNQIRNTRSAWGRSLLSLALVLAALFAAGAFSWEAHTQSQIPHEEWTRLTNGDEVVINGWVAHDGLLRGSGAQRRQSVDIQVESAERIMGSASIRNSSFPHERQPKPRKPKCVSNAAFPAELLRASGLPVCPPPKPKPEREAKRAKAIHANLPDTRPRENIAANGIIRLSLYGQGGWDEADDTATPDNDEQYLPRVLTYGQRVRFTARLRPPRNFDNPGALDYAGYLRKQGIYALGSVRSDRIETLAGTAGDRYGLWCSRIRRSILAKVHRLWPQEEAGLLDAMLIGERSFIGRETTTAFQRTGIYHILVVSGMNVGILAFVVFWALRRFRCGELIATIATILLACGYAYVAEMGAPIVRSVIMLAVYLCTRLLYRDRAMLNAIGTAALVLLVIDPTSVSDASFLLTVFSVLAIAGIAVPLLERTSQPYRDGLRLLGMPARDLSLAPRVAQFRIDLRMIAERIANLLPRWPSQFRGAPNRVLRTRAAQRCVTSSIAVIFSAWELAVVSATTQIALALPMAWYFHRATVVGLAANMVAVPLTGVLMPASVAAVAVAYVWIPLARPAAAITSCSLRGITETVGLLGGLEAADMRLAAPGLLTALLAALAFVVAILLLRRRRTLAIIGIVGLAASALCIALVPAKPQIQPGVLEVTGIDVGQAESFFVVTPEGKTLLIDAAGPLGPWQSEFDFGADVIAPYLWSRGISRLDAVVVTHAHSDHIGGMPSVLAAFHPRELWVGPNAPDPALERLLQQATVEKVRIVTRSGGDAFDFGGAHVRVLSPPPGWYPAAKPKNDDSLVLHLRYGSTSALLEADAEQKSEQTMTREVQGADLLKVAHNGSRTSSTPEFLAAVQPRFALISVGARNSFGHPRPEVLERLTAMHVATYRTDLFGAVTFELDGKQVRPKTRYPRTP